MQKIIMRMVININKFKDLTDEKIGMLMVIKTIGVNSHRQRMWLCKCDCGGEVRTTTNHLNSKHTQSCGCNRIKNMIEASKKSNSKHNMRYERIYRTWINMRVRCLNNKSKNYKNYGGRGITICKKWEDFIEFYIWAMKNGYKENLTIDRKDVNGNYEPDNCRWITSLEQQRNKRNNIIIEFNNKTQSITKWAQDLGIKYCTLLDRISKYKWTVERAFTEPVHTKTYKKGI